MKTIIIIAGFAVVVGLAAVSSIFNEEMVVVNEREATVVETVVEEETDLLDIAKQELERINSELDAEETRLLEDIKAIEAEAQAKIVEKKARLEKIRETRGSFQ